MRSCCVRPRRFLKVAVAGLVPLFIFLTIGPVRAENLANERVTELLERGIAKWRSVSYMETTLIRRERLVGQDEIGQPQVIECRFRSEPRSVYMRWLDGPGKSRELAWVQGRNNNMFKVTPGGLLAGVIVDRRIDDAEVFKVSRHTVMDAGIGQLLEKVHDQFEAAGSDAMVFYKGVELVDGRECDLFYRFLPQKQGYYCWKLELYIDRELGLPVRATCYDWLKQPFEDYVYTDVELNVPQTAEEFAIGKSSD